MTGNTQDDLILQVQHVYKRFGGLQALTDVTFDLPQGQILGLIGPNGAGKTTLFNCINGVYAPEDGRVIFRGQDITGWKPYRVAHMGLARTHQIVQPLNELTVLENVMAGACYGHESNPLGRAQEIADEVLAFVGLAVRRDALAASLNVAQKKRLELALLQAQEDFKTPPLIAEWLPMSNILYPILQQIILGDVDAQAGLDTAAEQVRDMMVEAGYYS